MKSFRVLIATMLLQMLCITNLSAQALLPFGQTTRQPWEAKYFHHESTDLSVTPGDNWYATDFDDSSWGTIMGPISNTDNYYYASRWEPDNSTYWVRRHFTMDSISDNMTFIMQTTHDDDCVIYLNGQHMYQNDYNIGYINTQYIDRSYLQKGDNVLAIRVRNYGGSLGYMDVGLDLVIEENGIRYIGTEAYEVYDGSLTEYTIKEGTTAIRNNLFDYKTNVTSITLPEGLQTIGDYAFSNCQNLKTINIPSSVEYIGNNAFNGCTSLPIEDGIRYADSYA